MIITAYAVDDEVSIKLCAPFVSPIGNKPEYWYIVKPYRSWDRHDLKLIARKPTDPTAYTPMPLYWNGTAWDWHTPKQFSTQYAALAEFRTVICPKHHIPKHDIWATSSQPRHATEPTAAASKSTKKNNKGKRRRA